MIEIQEAFTGGVTVVVDPTKVSASFLNHLTAVVVKHPGPETFTLVMGERKLKFGSKVTASPELNRAVCALYEQCLIDQGE